jgi:hypothetical protein
LHALEVFPVQGRYLELSFWAEHPDVGERPVNVQIWRGGDELPKTSLVNHTPVTWYVRAPADSKWMTLRFDVNRAWTPEGLQAPQYGVTVAAWNFVDKVPPGAGPLVE